VLRAPFKLTPVAMAVKTLIFQIRYAGEKQR
jgi:hypothetical protein